MEGEQDELIAQALIGREAEDFLESDLGRTMLGIAEQEKSIAQEKLKSINPREVYKIETLQNEIWRAESFRGWIEQLVSEGQQALEAYKHQQENE